MLLQSRQLDKHSKEFSWPGSATSDPGLPCPRGCLFSFVVSSSSDLRTMRPALATLKIPYFNTTPITSAGMSRHAIPAASLVGCLNSNTTFISSHLGGSSSLSLRHVAHLLLFARASSSVLQGSVKKKRINCARQITSTLTAILSGIKPTLFNSWFMTELVLLLLLLQNICIFFLI